MSNSASLNFDLFARDKSASKTFDKFGKTADKTGSKIQKFGKVAKVGLLAFGGAVTAGVAGLALFAKAAMDDQKSQTRLAQTLKNTTGATRDQIASVEDWISAQGRAFGVADDDLRPALEKLSTATGDITKAQGLASLAMDVSAGTGKSLESVSLALAKAYNGNVGGLGRLGIATKDAQGKTKTFAQIQDDLAKKFKGQAATAADTFAGRVQRFKVAISEAGETIGYALLPMLTRIAGVIVDDVIPWVGRAADKIGDFFTKLRKSKGVQGAFDAIKSGAENIGDGFAKAKRSLDKIKSTIGTLDLNKLDGSKIGKALGDAVVSGLQRLGQLAGKIGQTLGKMFDKVDWVGLGIAVGKQAPALVIGIISGIAAFDPVSLFKQIAAHWQTVLIAALTIAFMPAKFAGALEKILVKIPFVGKFLAVALRWVNGIGGKLKGFAADLMKSFWAGFTHAPIPGAAAVGRIMSGLRGIPGAVSGFFKMLQTRIGVWALDAFEAMGRGARGGVSKLLGYVRTIAGKIVGALGNLGSLLFNAGSAVIQGLINGVTSKIGALKSKLGEITKMIPKIKGPYSKDKVLLTPAGIAIMEGLLHGMKKKWQPVKDFLQKVTDKVASTRDKLAEVTGKRNDFAAGFQSFSTSIFGRDVGQDAEGNANPESVKGIRQFAAIQRMNADKLAKNVQRLVNLGLSKSLLTQLQGQGASGIAQINTLGKSATRSDIAFLNAQDKATTAANQRAGMAAANAIYGADVAKAKRDADTAKAIADAVHKALKDNLDGKLVAEVRGDKLIFVIRQEQKKHGKKPTV